MDDFRGGVKKIVTHRDKRALKTVCVKIAKTTCSAENNCSKQSYNDRKLYCHEIKF